MLKKFWEKEPAFIGFSGIVATVGALFLNIPIPKNQAAQASLANIQVFWLILFIVCLIRLFYRFIRLVIESEQKMQKKYDLPFAWPFSVTLGGIFLIVIANFGTYIFNIYATPISEFISMVFPGFVFIGSFLLLIYVEKNPSKFTRFSYLVVVSFVGSTLLTLMGMYFQQAVLGYFYFYWTNLVYPVLFVGLLLTLIIVSLFRKKPLTELLSLKVKADDEVKPITEQVSVEPPWIIYNGVPKIMAAEEQLKTAIRLFLKDEDPISVHALASAAQEILETLAKKQGTKSLKQQALDVADESKRKNLLKAMNEAKNSFKHADRDSDKVTKLSQGYTEMVLFDAVTLYYSITQQKVPAFMIYDLWVYSKYREAHGLKPDVEAIYIDMLAGHTHEDKNHFLRLIADLENKLKESIKPDDKVVRFMDKNFGSQAVVFNTDTNVWSVYFTLNGQNPANPDEQIILNFYLSDVWKDGSVAPEIISQRLVNGNKNIVGIPFIAPDPVTKKSAHFVFLSIPQEDYGYLHMMKIASMNDCAFSVVYSKRITGIGDVLQKNIHQWLFDDLKSSIGASTGIGNMGVDILWLDELRKRQKNQ